MTILLMRQCFFMIVSLIGVSLVSFSLVGLDSESSNLSYSYFISELWQNESLSASRIPTLVATFIEHLPASIELVVLASLLAIFAGIPMGIIAARNHRTLLDTSINNLSVVAYSLPIFWWAIILVIFIALEWQLTPVAGRLSFIYDIEQVTGFMLIDTFISNHPYRLEALQDAINHLILPVVTLATLPTAIITRMTRQIMLVTLNQDYIKTAQSKGLSSFKIYWHHGLRNALGPLTNMLALQISTLMSGAMVTEYIYSWPGIGKWLMDAFTRADYLGLAVGVMLTAAMVIIINGVIELLGLWLNPKVRRPDRVYYG